MKKAVRLLSLLFVVIIAVCVAFIRFLQLLKFTDKQTNLINSNCNLSFVAYGIMFVGLIFCIVYAFIEKDKTRKINFIGSKSIYMSLICLCGTYFYDFIHQCSNCYDYLENASLIEYHYLIPLGISGLFALLSSFYFFIVSLTVKETNYDFRNFTFFHFVPIIWAFSRLIIIMLKIVDIRTGIESVCEFLFLVAFLCFSFSCVSVIDTKRNNIGGFFVFCAVMLFLFSIILALPRILMIVLGKSFLLYNETFSSITYLVVGVFALIITINSNLEKKES